MASYSGPNNTASNLILCLDASNPKSYSGSGSIWYDVASGYQAAMSNLSASNYITYNGVKCFETNDTNNQNFTIPNFPFPQSGRTYEIWLNTKSFSLGWQTWFDDSGGERILFGTSTNSISIYPDLDFTNANLQINTWYQIAYTLTGSAGSTAVAYLNGVQIGIGTYNSTPASSGTLYILGDPGAEITSCRCNIARIYNRALSATEILQNFNTTRLKFGI